MPVLAIDGPAGAGKSTIARAIAARLGMRYLDTGAMYRAVASAALHEGLALDDLECVGALARRMDLDVALDSVTVDGRDVTNEIRTDLVTRSVAPVASNSAVRAELRARQRAWAARYGGGVIEGRDIGSVVFPEAPLKLYLTASPRARAERRVLQTGGDVDEIERAITERDQIDAARRDGPMVAADGSVTLDTTGLSIDQVVDRAVQMWERATQTESLRDNR